MSSAYLRLLIFLPFFFKPSGAWFKDTSGTPKCSGDAQAGWVQRHTCPSGWPPVVGIRPSSGHLSQWTLLQLTPARIWVHPEWCWRRLLRVSWTARRSNQSILKEINPECSWEGLKLKLQYVGHLMWRVDSLEKTLMLGKIKGKRRRGWQRMRRLESITDIMDMNLSKLQEIVKDRGAWLLLPMRSQSWTRLSDWTTATTRDLGKSCWVESGKRTELWDIMPVAMILSHLILCWFVM